MTRLARTPFLDGRTTPLAGPTFLHINTLARSVGSILACEQALRGAPGREKGGEFATSSLEFEHRQLVMTSLPLARVFQSLFTFALVSALR